MNKYTMCSHNTDKNRKEYTSPLRHITVPHRAQAQGNHCSEMQTTQLKMIQTLKPFLPEYFQQASLNKNPKLGRSDKPQTPLTRHLRQPGTQRPGLLFSREQTRVPGFRILLYPNGSSPGSAASLVELTLFRPQAGAGLYP